MLCIVAYIIHRKNPGAQGAIPYGAARVEGPEFETIALLGSSIDNRKSFSVV